MIPVFITLGSNLNPAQNLPWAVTLLQEQLDLIRVSHVYESAALGPDGQSLDQPGYLNAAVLVNVRDDIQPKHFKHQMLRAIESTIGRVRTADKYAARPIDLDIALYGDLIIPSLNIPDPEIFTRAHVALPLADLAPEHHHPISGQSLIDIAARFEHQPGIIKTDLQLLP